jgi:hypothetical protein
MRTSSRLASCRFAPASPVVSTTKRKIATLRFLRSRRFGHVCPYTLRKDLIFFFALKGFRAPAKYINFAG